MGRLPRRPRPERRSPPSPGPRPRPPHLRALSRLSGRSAGYRAALTRCGARRPHPSLPTIRRHLPPTRPSGSLGIRRPRAHPVLLVISAARLVSVRSASAARAHLISLVIRCLRPSRFARHPPPDRRPFACLRPTGHFCRFCCSFAARCSLLPTPFRRRSDRRPPDAACSRVLPPFAGRPPPRHPLPRHPLPVASVIATRRPRHPSFAVVAFRWWRRAVAGRRGRKCQGVLPG